MFWFVIFIWTHGMENLELFLDDLNRFDPNTKFTHDFNIENIRSTSSNV